MQAHSSIPLQDKDSPSVYLQFSGSDSDGRDCGSRAGEAGDTHVRAQQKCKFWVYFEKSSLKSSSGSSGVNTKPSRARPSLYLIPRWQLLISVDSQHLVSVLDVMKAAELLTLILLSLGENSD